MVSQGFVQTRCASCLEADAVSRRSVGFPLGCPLLGTLLRHQAAVVDLGLALGHRLSDVGHDGRLDVGEPACQLGSGVLGLLAQIGGVVVPTAPLGVLRR